MKDAEGFDGQGSEAEMAALATGEEMRRPELDLAVVVAAVATV